MNICGTLLSPFIEPYVVPSWSCVGFFFCFCIKISWGQIWGQPMDRVLSSLILLGLLGYPAFDPRLALV